MAKYSRFDSRNKKKRQDKYRGDKRRREYEEALPKRSLWEEVVSARADHTLRR